MIHYEVHPCNPQPRFLNHAAALLKNENGICVYPTDTVYGMGACASNIKAVLKIAELLKKDKKRMFSYICTSFSQASVYAKISNANFKLMKRYLPGPFTFILPATNYVPKKISPRRKTVGIRIPDCPICLELVRLIEEPLGNTSLRLPGQERGDPKAIKPAVMHEVDIMLDIGPLPDPRGSTIVDLTGDVPEIIRMGKGEWGE
ncbi:MAG: threonylcarbamoyl-AMP synthase [Chitinivibrionales bacterium]|nr:threonylcarbamoyl-AMP synthase [Chitinivibrionales bacterium]